MARPGAHPNIDLLFKVRPQAHEGHLMGTYRLQEGCVWVAEGGFLPILEGGAPLSGSNQLVFGTCVQVRDNNLSLEMVVDRQ